MNNYNAQSQAQKGFKTFILTLSVSLIVFSVVYYFISESQTVSETKVLSENTEVSSEEKEESVFGKLASTEVATPQKAVLAGTTTSPTTTAKTTTTTTTTTTAVKESTVAPVPHAGTTEITFGFFASLLAFVFGFFVISKNPRKLAMESFEKKMLRD